MLLHLIVKIKTLTSHGSLPKGYLKKNALDITEVDYSVGLDSLHTLT